MTSQMTFEEWCADLDRRAEQYVGENYTSQTGVSCWRPAFDAGLTPEEALNEDMQHWEAD